MSHPPLQSQSLNDWLFYIEQSHPIEKIELGLARVQQVAARADLQQLPGSVVLIAGTNGKGTTARTLELLLQAQGLSVGVYSSPHLIRFNERLRLNGQDVDDATWVQGMQAVEAVRGDVPLTYFEFTTLAAFAVLKQQQPDVCLIEVGLGGRLDATNIITPTICVITTIDLDHQDWLGHDRETIGREKAGVFRANTPVVIGDLAAPQSVCAAANILNCQTMQVGVQYQYAIDSDSWSWSSDSHRFDDLPRPQVPVQNVATALACLELLQKLPSEGLLQHYLPQLALAGRMQWLSQTPAVLLDVAHNPQSAQYLSEQLQLLQRNYRQIHLIAGMLKDKDIAQALGCFISSNYQWHLLSLPGVRGAPAELLARQLPASEQVTQVDQLPQLLDDIKASTADQLWVVFGSFVTVSEFIQLWTQDGK